MRKTTRSDGYHHGNFEVFYHENQFPADHPTGWYWWSCFEGCLPDGDPTGPFETAEEAYNDARWG